MSGFKQEQEVSMDTVAGVMAVAIFLLALVGFGLLVARRYGLIKNIERKSDRIELVELKKKINFGDMAIVSVDSKEYFIFYNRSGVSIVQINDQTPAIREEY